MRLLSFHQHEAYHRRFRFLAPVTVPAGMAQPGPEYPEPGRVAPGSHGHAGRSQGFPPRPDSPAAGDRCIHGKGDELSEPGRIPVRIVLRPPLKRRRKAFFHLRPTRIAASAPFLDGLARRSGQGDADPARHADDAARQGSSAAHALACPAQDLPLVYRPARNRPAFGWRHVGARA